VEITRGRSGLPSALDRLPAGGCGHGATPGARGEALGPQGSPGGRRAFRGPGSVTAERTATGCPRSGTITTSLPDEAEPP
jgi:hypothetical protein